MARRSLPPRLSRALPFAFAAALGLSALRIDDVFFKDAPDRLVSSSAVGTAGAYDGDVLAIGDARTFAWVEHTPGAADTLVVGRAADAPPTDLSLDHVFDDFARYASPRLTSVDGAVWLTYEARETTEAPWAVYAVELPSSGPSPPGAPTLVSVPALPGANAVDHDAAASPDGRLWVVWQAPRPVGDAGERIGLRGTQFDVMMRVVPSDGAQTGAVRVSTSPLGDWHPRIAFTSDGVAWIVWDAFDGRSFNVVGRRHEVDSWSSVEALASTDAFEGRAAIATFGDRAWVAYEEGPRNWGEVYRSIDERWNNATDDRGPVHRLQRMHLVEWTRAGAIEPRPVPMPAFDAAAAEPRRDGVRDLGVHYERAELCTAGRGRPWLFYRHFADLQVGRQEDVLHHIETGWDVYARALTDGGWSELFAFDRRQRDGAQRLAVHATPHGAAALWTTGRTDRRKDDDARGLAFATLELVGGAAPSPSSEAAGPGVGARAAVDVRVEPSRPPKPATVAGATYELAFGDLHRHTDLSLCFPFFDGSLDDAYRYGVEVARLDFLAVTDHARDLDRGDVESQVWRRVTKAVTRNRLPGAFVPFFAFERSQGATDHNVISLRADVLRPHTPPLPEFWAELDGDTLTIPHNTIPSQPFCGKVWDYHDDDKRPLVEVYQGMRDRAVVEEASVGLAKGYHMGFIASSDHISTNASFACVWTPSREREPLFRAMQARRTYAATARIRLVVHAGGAWMGRRVAADRVPPFTVEVDGTSALKSVELVREGAVVAAAPADELDGAAWRGTLAAPSAAASVPTDGETWLFVRVEQADGERAWASPIWFARAD